MARSGIMEANSRQPQPVFNTPTIEEQPLSDSREEQVGYVEPAGSATISTSTPGFLTSVCANYPVYLVVVCPSCNRPLDNSFAPMAFDQAHFSQNGTWDNDLSWGASALEYDVAVPRLS